MKEQLELRTDEPSDIDGNVSEEPSLQDIEEFFNEYPVVGDGDFDDSVYDYLIGYGEMMDFVHVMRAGAEKYDKDNWLLPEGHHASHKAMHASMFRHLADSHAGNREDRDSGFDPLLHLATRALMMYTRLQREIYHPADDAGHLAAELQLSATQMLRDISEEIDNENT